MQLPFHKMARLCSRSVLSFADSKWYQYGPAKMPEQIQKKIAADYVMAATEYSLQSENK